MTTFALIFWPLLVLVLARRVPLPEVILIALIGGYLFLPTQIAWDLPLLPPLDKDSIPAFAALLVALVMGNSAVRRGTTLPGSTSVNQPGWLPRSSIALWPLGLILVGTFLTVVTNRDALVYGPLRIPALRPYDAFSILMLTGVTLVPLLLGRKFFAHPDRHWLLLRSLVIAGLVYSLLALYEIRMSPQLNNMVYGFFPHSWHQHVRGGGLGWGWRPLVFLWHGLALAIFLAMTVLAAFGSSRIAPASRRMFYLLAGGWLLLTLVLTNSLGALVITLLLLPVALMLGVRGQLLVAAAVAGITLTYPMLRNADVVPTERLVAMAAQIDSARARSLEFRFEQEDALLGHARERPLFGWGTYGRNRLYDDQGRNMSVTDGYWVIVFGHSGWVGYLGNFGLLTLPIMVLAFRRVRYKVSSATALLALVLAAHLIDLIPNGFTSPVFFLIAGALIGRLELARIAETVPSDSPETPTARSAVYAREGPRPAPGSSGQPETAISAEGRDTPVYTRQKMRHQRAKDMY